MRRAKMLQIEGIRADEIPRAFQHHFDGAAANEIFRLLALVEWQRKLRFAAIEDEEVSVPFLRRIAALARKGRNVAARRDVYANTIRPELPMVVWALDGFADDAPAPEVGAQMAAPRIQHAHLPARSAKRDQSLAEYFLRQRSRTHLRQRSEIIPRDRMLREMVWRRWAIHWMIFPAKRFSTCSVAGCGPRHIFPYAASRLPRDSHRSSSKGR
jgi:hypothetical protein